MAGFLHLWTSQLLQILLTLGHLVGVLVNYTDSPISHSLAAQCQFLTKLGQCALCRPGKFLHIISMVATKVSTLLPHTVLMT